MPPPRAAASAGSTPGRRPSPARRARPPASSPPPRPARAPRPPPASFEPGTPAVPGTPSVATNTRTRRPATVLGNRSVLGQLEADLVGALISHRFEILYLAFTIAFIGVCLSSRLLVPRARQLS